MACAADCPRSSFRYRNNNRENCFPVNRSGEDVSTNGVLSLKTSFTFDSVAIWLGSIVVEPFLTLFYLNPRIIADVYKTSMRLSAPIISPTSLKVLSTITSSSNAEAQGDLRRKSYFW